MHLAGSANTVHSSYSLEQHESEQGSDYTEPKK